MAERLGANFGIDITALRSGLNEANRLIKASEAEFQAAAAGMENWNKSEEGLVKRQETLNRQIDFQKGKIKSLTEEKERLVAEMKAEGKSDEEIAKATEKVNDLINKEGRQLTKLESNLSKTTYQLDNYRNSQNKAGDETDKTVDRMEKLNRANSAVNKGLAVVTAAAVAAAAAMSKMVVDTAEAGDEIQKNSQKVGLSYESYQRWNYAMQISGTEMTAVAGGLKRLTSSVDSALSGNKSAVESFNRLGISVNNLRGKTREDIFELVVKSLQNVTDDTEKAALATDMFGRSGQNLIPLLNMTNDELQGLFTEFNEIGGVLSDDVVNASAEFEDELTKVRAQLTSTKNEVIGGFLPALTEMIDAVDWKQVSKTIGDAVSKMGKAFLELAKSGIEIGVKVFPVIANVVGWIADNFKPLIITVLSAVAAFKAFAAVMAIATAVTQARAAIAALEVGVGAVTKAQAIWNAVMAANPIGAVITAVTLLVGGIALLASAFSNTVPVNEYSREIETLGEVVDGLSEKTATLNDKMKSASESGNEQASAASAQADRAADLWLELSQLADETGRVDDNNRSTAEYILSQLNEALGTEYKMIGNQIQGYKQLADNIDLVIQKKKEEAYFSAYQEKYTTALTGKDQAQANAAALLTAYQREAYALSELKREEQFLQNALKKMNQNPNKYTEGDFANAAYEIGALQKQITTGEEAVSKAKKAYNDALQSYNNMNATITTYETAQRLSAQGWHQSAIETLETFNNSIVKANDEMTDAQKATLENQAVSSEAYYRALIGQYAKTRDTLSGVEKAKYERDIAAAKKRRDEAVAEYKKAGGQVTVGFAEGINEKTYIFSSSLENLCKSGVQMILRSWLIRSPSRVTREMGWNIVKGLTEGITEKTNTLTSAIKKQSAEAISAYNLSDISTATPSITPLNGSGRGDIIVNQNIVYSQPHTEVELYKQKQETVATIKAATAGSVVYA